MHSLYANTMPFYIRDFSIYGHPGPNPPKILRITLGNFQSYAVLFKIYICIYIYTHIHTHTYIHTHIYIHTHTHIIVGASLVAQMVKNLSEFSPCDRKIPWSRAMQPTPAFLPGEFHGERAG